MKKSILAFLIVVVVIYMVTYVTSNKNISGKQNNSGGIKEHVLTTMVKLADMIGMKNIVINQTLKSNHNMLVSSITLYAMNNSGAMPQHIDDLSPYVEDFDALLSSPKGAAYVISTDSDNNLTLTSAFDGKELVYKTSSGR